MRTILVTLAALLLFSAPVDAAAARAQLIYKVDHVSVSVAGKKMTVTATGAVKTGGWENPHLHVKEFRTPEANTLVIEFLAVPPSKDETVIQALLPVSAVLTTSLPPYGTTEIKVEAESNSQSVPYAP
jgi:hypothetical protein